GEAAFVAAGTGAHAEGQLGLFGLFGEQTQARSGLVVLRGDEARWLAGGKSRGKTADGLDDGLMREIARRGDERDAGHVIGPQKTEQVGARDGVDRFG